MLKRTARVYLPDFVERIWDLLLESSSGGQGQEVRHRPVASTTIDMNVVVFAAFVLTPFIPTTFVLTTFILTAFLLTVFIPLCVFRLFLTGRLHILLFPF